MDAEGEAVAGGRNVFEKPRQLGGAIAHHVQDRAEHLLPQIARAVERQDRGRHIGSRRRQPMLTVPAKDDASLPLRVGDPAVEARFGVGIDHRPHMRRGIARSARRGAAFRRARRARGVSVRRQRFGQGLHPGLRLCGRHHGAVPPLQVSHLPAGELGDRSRPGDLGEEAQGTGGKVVIRVFEGAAPDIGDGEQLGRAAAAAAGRTAQPSWRCPG